MVKLRNSRNLDARQSALVDNAYFAVHPPERVGARRKQRPPEHAYIRHLVLDSLSKDEVKPVLLPSRVAHPFPRPVLPLPLARR